MKRESLDQSRVFIVTRVQGRFLEHACPPASVAALGLRWRLNRWKLGRQRSAAVSNHVKMDSTHGPESAPSWLTTSQQDALLRLPPDRRPVAIARLREIRGHLSREEGGSPEVRAARLGISTSRFYALVATWKKTGSVDAVAPYASMKPTRPERTVQQTREIIEQALARAAEAVNPPRFGKLVAEIIAETERRGLAAPSPTAVRRRLLAHDGLLAKQRATGQLGVRAGPEGSFGTTLVIDHVIAALRFSALKSSQVPARPSGVVTLLFDHGTGLVLGWDMGDGPTAMGIARALLTSTRKPPMPDHPFFAGRNPAGAGRLIYDALQGTPWNALSDALQSCAITSDVIEDKRLRWSDYAGTRLGRELGSIQILRQRSYAPRMLPEPTDGRLPDQSWRDPQFAGGDLTLMLGAELVEYNSRIMAEFAGGNAKIAAPPRPFGQSTRMLDGALERMLKADL